MCVDSVLMCCVCMCSKLLIPTKAAQRTNDLSYEESIAINKDMEVCTHHTHTHTPHTHHPHPHRTGLRTFAASLVQVIMVTMMTSPSLQSGRSRSPTPRNRYMFWHPTPHTHTIMSLSRFNPPMLSQKERE